jgi:hypothetical protein
MQVEKLLIPSSLALVDSIVSLDLISTCCKFCIATISISLVAGSWRSFVTQSSSWIRTS